jgi:Peptidase family S64
MAYINRGKKGDRILSHGASNVIGNLYGFKAIDFTNPNDVDLAIADCSINKDKNKDILKVRDAVLGEKVFKLGATTGLTYGEVVSIDYTDVINYDGQDATFQNQVRIEPTNGTFSAGGDSGSIVYSTDDNAFVGLHFAGNGDFSLSNHAQKVELQLSDWGIVI